MTSSPRTVLITGGGTGIGAAISRAFLALADTIAVVQRDERETAEAVTALGDVTGFACDLSGRGQMTGLITRVTAQLGPIDVLVNCAAVTGAGSGATLLELDDNLIDTTIAVNLASVIRLSRDAARGMSQAGRGVIITIGSVAAHAAQRDAAVYCATKAGVDALTRSLAYELSPLGVRAVSIAPGDIDTSGSATHEPPIPVYGRTTPYVRRGLPQDVADAVVFAASEHAAFISGSEIRVDGGWLTH